MLQLRQIQLTTFTTSPVEQASTSLNSWNEKAFVLRDDGLHKELLREFDIKTL